MNKTKYNEPNALSDVASFHSTFKLPIEDHPIVPSSDRCKLRLNLLKEELEELEEAIEADDITEIADALADIQYVLSGAILEFGLAERFKKIFDEVQRSNMSKACQSLEEAKQTQDHYLKTKGTESYIAKVGQAYIVYREGDHKVLKSIRYSAADIPSCLK